MRTLRFIGALAAMLTFSAIGVATTASAAEILWKWLPGSVGETFKGGSGEILWTTKFGESAFKIKCAKASLLLTYTFKPKEGEQEKEVTASSELVEKGSTEKKDATLSLWIVHVEGCSTAGLTLNSMGDKSGIILLHVEEHNCMISAAKKEFGVLLEALPGHIEVPALKGTLVLLRGAVIGLLLGAKEKEKVLTYKLDLNAPGGVQEIKKCEGGVENKLEVSLDGVKFEPETVEAKEGVVEFDMTKDTAGEEMMEK